MIKIKGNDVDDLLGGADGSHGSALSYAFCLADQE